VAAGLVAHHPVLQAEVQRAVTHKPSVVPRAESHKAHPADSGGYVFSTLDDPNAGTNGPGGYGVQGTFILGINDRGLITGNYGDANDITHGLLLSHGKWTTFDDPSAGTGPANPSTGFFPGTDAAKTNIHVQTVGWYVDQNNVEHSFLLSGGNYTTIDPPGAANKPGPTFTNVDEAGDINDRGQIVGLYTDTSGNTHGYLLSDGHYTKLDDPNAHGAFTGPAAINNSGQIVGFYSNSTSLTNGVHGFLLSDGHYTTLDDPNAGTGAGQGTFALMINASGQITGFYVDAESAAHGFVLSDGHYTTLDDPAGTRGTFPEGMNDKGQIVGYYVDSNGLAHGFLAKPSH